MCWIVLLIEGTEFNEALFTDYMAGYGPDVTRNQNFSILKAKKAISDYKKALGRPVGVAELSVFYCESCAELLRYCGMDHEGYFNALAFVFEQALKAISLLEAE